MKICCVGYRKWALDIYKMLSFETFEIFLIDDHCSYEEKKIIDFNPDYVLFYGWSWVISKELISNYICVMLHPSPLPKYRGGSPLQNQIINGETDSAVTLFIMDQGIDTGDIIGQKYLSLKGELNTIFKNITRIGFSLTMDFLKNGIKRRKQNHSEATFFNRIKEENSEISIEDLKTKDGNYLYNKVRMLEDPYPNAFFRTSDGKKLIIKKVEIE